MALKPNPILAELAKRGMNMADEIVPLTGLVVSADARTVVLRSGLMDPETITVSADDVLYSEQTDEGGLALVIVRPDAQVTVTTTAVAFQQKGGSGSGSGDDPVAKCIERKRNECIDGKMLEGKPRKVAEAACDNVVQKAVRESLCRRNPSSIYGGGIIIF